MDQTVKSRNKNFQEILGELHQFGRHTKMLPIEMATFFLGLATFFLGLATFFLGMATFFLGF